MTSATAPKKRILAGQYEVLEIVGRGAASVVYRARYLDKDQSELAIKVLLNKEELGIAANRLRKEALAMVAARHNYVLRLDDFHSLENLHYLTMEFAPFSDLRNYLNYLDRTLSPAEAERYFRQITEALSFVHNVGIIHRDIKPDNFLVINERQIRLGDFSAALLPGEDSSFEELQKGIGSLDYLAPEVLRGETCGTFSDVYSLGISFYECITGINPLADIPMAEMLSAREDENFTSPLTYCPDLNRSLASIIMKCLSFDPQNRFQSGSEVLKALDTINADALNTASSQPRLNLNVQSDEEEFLPEQNENILDFPGSEEGNTVSNEQEQENIAEIEEDEFRYSPQESENKNSKLDPNSYQQQEQALSESDYNATSTEVSNVNHGDLLETPESEHSGSFTKKSNPNDSEVFTYKQQNQSIKSSNEIDKKSSNLLPIIAGVLIFLIVFKLTLNIFSTNDNSITENFLPNYQGGSLSFPDLPAGSYIGVIDNLIPNAKLAMIAISKPQEDTITILFAKSGFAPINLSLQELQSSEKAGSGQIIINERGYILQLQVEALDNSIKGTFVNLLNNEKGSWELLPKT